MLAVHRPLCSSMQAFRALVRYLLGSEGGLLTLLKLTEVLQNHINAVNPSHTMKDYSKHVSLDHMYFLTLGDHFYIGKMMSSEYRKL